MGTHFYQLGRSHHCIIWNQICGHGEDKGKCTQILQMTAALLNVHTDSIHFPFLLLSLQIHANCRIQSVYFSDRLYCHEEMPSDYKVLISGERQTAPRINIVMADQSPLVGHQGPRKKEKKPTGHGDHGRRSKLDQTEAADVDGFQSILNSATKDPLKLWKKEVSIYASNFSCTNISSN